jgi:tRNA pseudouridine32 synthase/23S rRNA pseudouridine746 synthase
LRGKALRALMAQFRERRVSKEYLALVEGDPGPEGTIDLPLSPIPGQPRSRVDPAGRPALTRWRRLERRGERSLVALYPETGRSHQLRVHLAALGTPIAGDRWYGQAGAPPAERLWLHAARLELLHPYRGDPLRLFAPPPRALTEGFGLHG